MPQQKKSPKKTQTDTRSKSLGTFGQILLLSVLVLLYLLIGAGIFYAAERPNEERMLRMSRIARNDSISTLQSFLLNSTNIPEYAFNDTIALLLELGAVVAEADAALSAETNPMWDYASSIFFCSSVITTIGTSIHKHNYYHRTVFCYLRHFILNFHGWPF